MVNLLQGISLGLAGLSGNPDVADDVVNTVKTKKLLTGLNEGIDPANPAASLSSPEYMELAGRSPTQAAVFGNMIKAKGEEQRKREVSLLRDAMYVQKFLEDDNPEKAKALLRDRIKNIKNLGDDPSDTMEILTMVEAGDLDGAHELLNFTLQRGQMEGLIPGEEFVQMTEDGRMVMKNRFGEVVVRGEPGMSKNDREILKELRGNIRTNVDKIDERATSVIDNYNKIQELSDQVDIGNRNAAMSLLVALTKLGDPNSAVLSKEAEAQLNNATTSAAIAQVLLNYSDLDKSVVDSLLVSVDPLNPKNIKVADVKATADALISSTIPTIQEDFAIQREMGDKELTSKGRSSIFGERRINKIARLSDLMRPKPKPEDPPEGTVKVGKYHVKVKPQ